MAAVRALQAAQDRVLKHMAGQAHYDALLEAVATGLAHGAAAGLQKVRGAAGVRGRRGYGCCGAGTYISSGTTSACRALRALSCSINPCAQEGEGFRAACGSRAHALALRLFKLQRGLKHKSGVSGFFTRVRCRVGCAPCPGAGLG